MVPVLASTVQTALGALGGVAALLAAVGAFYAGIRKGNLDQRMAIDARSAKADERDNRFIDQLQETITELRAVAEARREQLRQNEIDMTAYREQVRLRENEIDTLRTTLRLRDQEVIQCRERLGGLEAQNTVATRRIGDLESAVRVLRGEAGDDQQRTITELTEQLERLRRGGPAAPP